MFIFRVRFDFTQEKDIILSYYNFVIKMVFHEILLYSGKCVSHRLIFVEILMCGHNGRPNGLRANDSKFGHLTLGYRPLLTVIKNTLINHSGHRHFPYMDSKWHQLHLHASLRRQSSSSILHCESPISFPRRIVPRRWKQPKRPPRRRLPAKSSTAAKLIDARSPPTPYPNSPFAVRHRGTQFELLLPSFDV